MDRAAWSWQQISNRCYSGETVTRLWTHGCGWKHHTEQITQFQMNNPDFGWLQANISPTTQRSRMYSEGRDGQNTDTCAQRSDLVYKMQKPPGLDGHAGPAGFRATAHWKTPLMTNRYMLIQMSLFIFFLFFFKPVLQN